jgi:hypothetical protein
VREIQALALPPLQFCFEVVAFLHGNLRERALAASTPHAWTAPGVQPNAAPFLPLLWMVLECDALG